MCLPGLKVAHIAAHHILVGMVFNLNAVRDEGGPCEGCGVPCDQTVAGLRPTRDPGIAEYNAGLVQHV